MRGGIVAWALLAALIIIATARTATAGYGDGETCDYSPLCSEFTPQGTLGCSACSAHKYNTACTGNCNYTSYGDCEYIGACALGAVRAVACPTAGYIKDQECSATACDWVDTSTCYLDPAGDPDGDGVPNSADSCPTTFAGSGTCNGCPNEDCSGTCFALETTCPPADARACVANAQANQNCAGFSCPASGCVGDTYCTYSGAPYCKESTGQCACPAASCVYSASCDADDDNDGVADVNDACPNTGAGQAVDFSGCSCAQKTCNDGKECTTDTCSSAQCVYTPRTPGTICNYLGDGTPNDGQCDASGTCVQSASCTATPGCRTSKPSFSHTVTGTCTSGQTCYACDNGYTWNPATGACEAPSCHQCATGQKKCASAGTSYYTCTTNPQGCRVWNSTTTTCGTADCTSYTCTPGETFTASCTAAPKGGPAPAVG